MCFSLFKKRNEYVKNSKKYIEKKFDFLLNNGYKYHYFFCNGEETFSFRKGGLLLEIYHDIYPFSFDVVIYDGTVSLDAVFKGKAKIEPKNINEFAGVNWSYIKSVLSPIEIVDYYADLVNNNLENLEKVYK